MRVNCEMQQIRLQGIIFSVDPISVVISKSLLNANEVDGGSDYYKTMMILITI